MKRLVYTDEAKKEVERRMAEYAERYPDMIYWIGYDPAEDVWELWEYDEEQYKEEHPEVWEELFGEGRSKHPSIEIPPEEAPVLAQIIMDEGSITTDVISYSTKKGKKYWIKVPLIEIKMKDYNILRKFAEMFEAIPRWDRDEKIWRLRIWAHKAWVVAKAIEPYVTGYMKVKFRGVFHWMPTILKVRRVIKEYPPEKEPRWAIEDPEREEKEYEEWLQSLREKRKVLTGKEYDEKQEKIDEMIRRLKRLV